MNLSLNRLSKPRDPKDWNGFLYECIYSDESPMSYGPRHEIIYTFCSEVLYPFVEKFGLTWRVSKKVLTSKVIRLLYELKKRNLLHINDLNNGYEYEYYDRYLYILDSNVWSDFWMKWNSISDFADDSFGYSVQHRIPMIVWNNISLEHSAMFDNVRQELQDMKQLEEYLKLDRTTRGKDDPYLQDILQGNVFYDKHYH